MGERAAYYPSLVQEPIYDQALSAIDRINDPRISKDWAKKGFEYGAIKLPDLLSPPTLLKMLKEYEVSIHEVGHGWMARLCNWAVDKMSIIPRDGALGVTFARPRSLKNIITLFWESIYIKFGGKIAEGMVGIHDHSGAGSDMGSAYTQARILSFITGDSQDRILSQAETTASRELGSIGQTAIEEDAWNLFLRKEVA